MQREMKRGSRTGLWGGAVELRGEEEEPVQAEWQQTDVHQEQRDWKCECPEYS